MKRMKTYSLSAKDIEKEWTVVDASGQILGRLATQVASLLMGKHKVSYSPHLDMGDYVIVINATQIKVTGNKLAKHLLRHLKVYGGPDHPHEAQVNTSRKRADSRQPAVAATSEKKS